MKKVFVLLVLAISFSCKKDKSSSGFYVQPPETYFPPKAESDTLMACPYSCINLPDSEYNSVIQVYYPTHLGWEIGAYGAIVTANNKIYTAGGELESYNGISNSVDIYDPNSDSWKSDALKTGRTRLSGVSLGSLVLFAGGNNHNIPYNVNDEACIYYSDVDIFNPAGEHFISQLSKARAYMASANFLGKGWFIGGRDIEKYSTRIDIYDPQTNSWSQMELPRERAYGAAVVINNRIFICGGKNSSGNLKTIDIYDAGTQQWSTLEAPNEHPHASAVLLNHKIFIAGGDGENNKSVDIYNTENQTWAKSELSDSRFDMGVGVANNKIIYMGGNFSNHIDVYDDITGRWTAGSVSPGNAGVKCVSFMDQMYFAGFLVMNGTTMTNNDLLIIKP